jgi:magnesium chelatase family protein
MLAKRILTILPCLTESEALETTKIYSVAGLLTKQQPILLKRSFRSPHHTSSSVALVGGGSYPRPGEVSLAHNGVLFLDELPEFRRDALEALRQPLEDGRVVISRAKKTMVFPAKFLLIATMNPCPCGYYGFSGKKVCHCTPYQIQRYRSKISGPLLDRIDLQIEMPALTTNQLVKNDLSESEPSRIIKERVEIAHAMQKERFQHSQVFFNSQMSHSQLRKSCVLSNKSREILEKAIDTLGLSARSYTKIIKIARTIADLDQAGEINSDHISEAIQYRVLDKSVWL